MEMAIFFSLFFLIISSFLALIRVIKGPTAPDRIVAIDILGFILVNFCALLTLITREDFYMSVALAWALLSFIGSIALAKKLEGKEFDE